jgi:CRP-like cAMP-binding protein
MSERPDTDEAARLVTAVAPRRSVEDALRSAGLQLLGPCERLSRQPGLLQDSPLLHDFTADEADILGRAMLRVRARAGQVLIAENDPSDWMLLLLSGTVDVGKRRVDPDTLRPSTDETARVAVLRPGAVLGEMSMLDGEPRYASCWALGDVEAAVLTRAALAGLIRDEPAVGAKLLVKITQLLAQQLRNTSNQLLRRLPRQAS